MVDKKWPAVNNILASSNIINKIKYSFKVTFKLEKLKFGLRFLLKKVIHKCKPDDSSYVTNMKFLKSIITLHFKIKLSLSSSHATQ